MDYEKEFNENGKQMGQHVISVCHIGLDQGEFLDNLAKAWKTKSTGKSKDYYTIVGYLKDGIPRRYQLHEFASFLNAVQEAINRCIRSNPLSSERITILKKWETYREEFLIKLLKFFFKAQSLEFSKIVKKGPYDDPNVLFVNFTYGSFPEEYTLPYSDPVITQSQADALRDVLRPHWGKFYKEILKGDEYAIHNARILGFCWKIWPENNVSLDIHHINQLRLALRQHSEWLLEKFCHNLPDTPDIWNGKSPAKLAALNLSQGDFSLFKEYLKFTEEIYQT